MMFVTIISSNWFCLLSFLSPSYWRISVNQPIGAAIFLGGRGTWLAAFWPNFPLMQQPQRNHLAMFLLMLTNANFHQTSVVYQLNFSPCLILQSFYFSCSLDIKGSILPVQRFWGAWLNPPCTHFIMAHEGQEEECTRGSPESEFWAALLALFLSRWLMKGGKPKQNHTVKSKFWNCANWPDSEREK